MTANLTLHDAAGEAMDSAPQPTLAETGIPASPPGRLRRTLTGLGNVAGFVAALVGAVVDLLRGRWDGPSRRRHRARGLIEKIAPFPVDD